MAQIAPLRAGDPTHLGPYRLTGLLGEGGQGAVYLAVREVDDAPDAGEPDAREPGGREPDGRVAVKLLHARFSGDPKARSRFAAEVAVAKRVSAFCTAPVLDSDVEGDRPYIVSEYIDGPALSAVLAGEGPRRGADLDRIAIGTMTALTAIHQAGVVHRDFKPANVLLAADGPRVIDFGIARALDATGTMSSTAVGTPAYMAPEQISGAPVGPAADVFAWGATMVYAATGRPAFGQDSIPAVMHRILNLPPDLGALAEPLRGLVADCLSKDPALRPTSARVLARLLELAGSPARPGAARDDEAPADMLTQGAEVAAASESRLLPSPLSPAQAPPSSPLGQTPPPHSPLGQTPPPHSPLGQTPPPPYPQAYQQYPGSPPPGAVPGPPWGPNASTPPPGGSTWPPGTPGSSGSGVLHTKPSDGPRRSRRGMQVLAGAGSAAVVALVVAGSVLAVNLLDGDSGGSGSSGGSAGRVGGTMQITVPAGTNTDGEIDPSHSFSGTDRFLPKQLFTGLVDQNPDGTLRNRLATSITPDATCENWTIGIRTGTTFSNGEPVDAEAFARGWARSAATTLGAGPVLMADIEGFGDVSGGKASELSGVRVSGTGLQVKLTSPHCEFAARLVDPVFDPVPEAAGKPDNDTYNLNPIGNGPFKLARSVKGQSFTLARNESWAFGRTMLDEVTVLLSTESAKGRAGVASGEYGWATINSEDYSTLAGEGNLAKRPMAFTRMIVPLAKRGPMADKNARLAVSYALDRSKISQAFGGVYPAAHGIVPSALPGFGATRPCPSCDAPDPVKAKQLATQAGLGPGTTVRLYMQETGIWEKVAALVRSQLETVLGWKIDLRKTPITKYEDYRKALVASDASGLAFYAWGPDFPDAYTMLWSILGGTVVAEPDNANSNLAGYRSSRFDELLSTAVRTPDGARRTGVYQQAERTALDDMALIPLVYDGRAAVTNPKYVGLSLDYDGDPTLTTAALK